MYIKIITCLNYEYVFLGKIQIKKTFQFLGRYTRVSPWSWALFLGLVMNKHILKYIVYNYCCCYNYYYYWSRYWFKSLDLQTYFKKINYSYKCLLLNQSLIKFLTKSSFKKKSYIINQSISKIIHTKMFFNRNVYT